MVFDTLKSVEELQEAGIPENQAKAQVRVFQRTLESDLATKHDIKDLEQETLQLKKDLQQETLQLKKNLQQEMMQLRKDLQQEMVQLRKDLQQEMRELEYRLTIKTGVMMVAATGITLGTIQYLLLSSP